MKKIFALIIFNTIILSGYAQDYSKYRIVFLEEFNYPDATDPAEGFKRTNTTTGPIPTAVSGSNVGHKFRDFWDLENGSWGDHVQYKEQELKIISPGIMRFHETKLTNPYLEPGRNKWIHYTAGYLKLIQSPRNSGLIPPTNYGYGIMEAKIKLPGTLPLLSSPVGTCQPTDNPTSPGSFWMNNNINEIDVIDMSFTQYYHFRAFDKIQPGQAHTIIQNIPSMADGYHIYSAVWSPSKIDYYIDYVYYTSIPYDVIRTYPLAYDLELAIMPDCSLAATDDQYMDVDWVRIWEPKCMDEDLFITRATGTDPFFQRHGATGRMFRYRNININSHNLLTLPYQTTVPTILHSESITIEGNFFADQSVLTTSTLALSDGHNTSTSTHRSNPFLEIKAVPCVSEDVDIAYDPPGDEYGMPGGERQGFSSNDGGKKTQDVSFSNYSISSTKQNLSISQNTTKHIKLTPNPTTGQLNITMPAPGDYDVKISNMLGVVVYQGKLKDEQRKQIQLENSLPSGNYTVQITGKDVNHIEKVALTR